MRESGWLLGEVVVLRVFVLNPDCRQRKRIKVDEKRRARMKRMAKTHGSMSCVAWRDGDDVVVRALVKVDDALLNNAMDAPIGIVVVDMRRLVRLGGEGVG